jgi:AhpD family alkylhydroperoxidase
MSKENGMTKKDKPSFYKKANKKFPAVFEAVEQLGITLRKAGPIDEKTSHLIQLAAASAMQSEGSVYSHTRRALLAGATPEEIHHTLLLLVSTIGFPQAMAAFSWVEEVTKKK